MSQYCLLNGSRFLNLNTTCLLNGSIVSTYLSNFIKMKKKNSVNQMNLNYEKPKKKKNNNNKINHNMLKTINHNN